MRTAAPLRVAPAAAPARRAAQTPHAPHASPRGRSLRSRVAPGVYEAQADPAQLLVLAATAGLGAFWWLVVVPGERRSLAAAKRRGDVREYLDGVEQDESRAAERWFYSDWLNAPWFRAATAKRRAAAAAAAAEAPAAAAAADTAASALPPAAPAAPPPADAPPPPEIRDVEPAFWNLDNPVVATGAMLAAMALLATLQHGSG